MIRTKKGDRFFYDVPNQENSFTEGRNWSKITNITSHVYP
jgi:hypothetical protein